VSIMVAVGVRPVAKGEIFNVHIDEQFMLTVAYRVEVRNEPDVDVDVDIDVAYDVGLRRVTPVRVTVLRRENGPEVSSAQLRTIRVRGYMAYAARNVLVMVYEAERGEQHVAYPLSYILGKRASEEAWADEKYRWVFRVYRIAEIVGLNPAKEVEESLNLSARTATRWIARAKEMGYFDRETIIGDVSRG